MAHDDHVDALAYALKYTFVPRAELNKKSGRYETYKHGDPKSWVIA